MARDSLFTRGDYAEFRGDAQTTSRMQRADAIAKMTPTERSALQKREAESKRLDAQQRSLINAFKYTNVAGLTKDKTNANIEKLRALSLNDSNPNQWLEFYRQVYPRDIVGLPLGKFRFAWDENGNKVFVPWTEQSWTNFFENPQRGRWIPHVPLMYKCPPEWATRFIGEFFAASENARNNFPANDAKHVWQYKSGDAKCKRPKPSTWVQIRKGVVGAVLVVAAVYLGPAVLTKIKGAVSSGAASGGAGASGASGAAQATTFQQIQAGSKTLLGYVNKARTIEAIAKGELPPPPIGIAGSSFREWALIVAKEKIKEEAMTRALEAGQEYVARKMTQKEEAALRADIAAMQRELEALTPAAIPIQPDEMLAPAIKTMQVSEEQKAGSNRELLKMALIIGIPATLFLVGA